MDSEQDAVPELRCALCDATLPAGVWVCERCSPPAGRTLPQTRSVEDLLRRARGQLLVGFWFLPIVFAPLALQTVQRAEAALASSGDPDRALAARARRLRHLALAATIFAYGVLALVIWSLSAAR